MASWEKFEPELRLTRIKIKNFRNINELDIEIPHHKKIICLVGPNGGSKSSLLSLIINALRGLTHESSADFQSKSFFSTTDKFHRAFSTSEIGKAGHGYVFLMDWQSKDGDYHYHLLTHKPESHQHEFIVQLRQEFAIPVTHKWILEEWKNSVNSKQDPVARSVFLFRPSDRFETPYYEEHEKNISFSSHFATEDWVGRRFYPIRATSGLAEVESLILEVILDQKMGNKYADLAIDKILHILKIFNISNEQFNIQPWPFRRVGLGSLYTLSLLSAGELDILVTAGNIIAQQIYLSRKFDLDGDNGILPAGWVFIDEVDAHLHPQWQKQLLPVFSELFPTINFMITTHSPFVLQSLPKDRSIVIRLPDGKVFEEDFASWCLNEILEIVFDIPSC